jgi:hypothetical protein
MNEFERFAALAAHAREDKGRQVDVTAGVLRSIRAASIPRTGGPPLWIVSGLSLGAASVMFFMAMQLWGTVADPMAGFFITLTMVMQ